MMKKKLSIAKSEMRGFKFCYDAVVPVVRDNDSKNQITIDEIKKILKEKQQVLLFLS